MSYILEALKKSQQERELGRVPTLETTGTFEDDTVVPDRSRGPILAVGLAAVAMIVALYAALRAPGSTPASTPPLTGVTEEAVPTQGGGTAAARGGLVGDRRERRGPDHAGECRKACAGLDISHARLCGS